MKKAERCWWLWVCQRRIILRGVSYAFFVSSKLYITDAFGQEHRIHNFVSCHGADVRHTK